MVKNNQPPARRDDRQQQMSENQVLTVQEKIRRVMIELNKWGPEIEPTLPADLPLKTFLSTINNALRTNPDLLQCEFDSLIQACVKAGYDGLRIDGREAAIVVSTEKGRKLCRYMPMVFGLIKQILQCGAAKAVKAVIVYENEVKEGRFRMLEGTVQGIHHEPILAGEKGEMVGVYSIATIDAGVFKFEWMDKEAVLDVRKESKYGAVWERWPTEMWKKTVIRRLRKSLAGTQVIIDSETKEMFPHFDQKPHPQLAAPIMPARRRAELEDQSGSSTGAPLDFGNQQQRQEVDQREQQRQPQQEKAKAAPEPSSEPIPANETEWVAWQREVEQDIAACTTPNEVQKIAAEERDRLAAASKERRDWISGVISDRLTDLVSEGSDGSAPVDGQDQQGQE